MSENKTLEAANHWQIERVKFLDKHPDQRVFLNEIECQLQNSLWGAVATLHNVSFAIREIDNAAKAASEEIKR